MSGHRTARVLVYGHRWLGIVLGPLFIVWFGSGIVMMYARMPELDARERLARLSSINPAFIRSPAPAEFLDAARLTITTLEGRPVYRATPAGRSVFADTGDPVPPVDADQAIRIARAFVGGHVEIRYDDRLLDADQWSFAVRGRMPLHRIAVEDDAGTRLYVAENGGEVVLKTTAAGRRWGAAGAVLHWLYFTPFRRNAGLWTDAIISLSLAGTVTCAMGLAWGLWRMAPFRGYRLRDHRQWSPYAASMRWHHYAGLLFGITTLTWVFSGLLSMDPWDWHPGTAPTRDQRARVTGALPSTEDLSADRIRKAIAAFSPEWPKEIELVRFRGHSYASAAAGIVALDAPHLGAEDMLSRSRRRGGFDRHARRCDRRAAVDGRVRRVLLRPRQAALVAGVARALWRCAADVAVFRSPARRGGAQGRVAQPREPMALPRLPQFRFSVAL